MGRDDKCQSVGIFQHRLKKTPPKPRFADMHRGAMMDKAADAYPPLIRTPRAYEDHPVPRKQRKQKPKFKDRAPRMLQPDFAASTPAARSSDFKISIEERERLLPQQVASEKRMPENDLENYSLKKSPSNTGCEQDTLKVGLNPENGDGSSQSQRPPTEPFARSPCNRPVHVLWSDGPHPHRRFILARYPQMEASTTKSTPGPYDAYHAEYLPETQRVPRQERPAHHYSTQSNATSGFQHYIPGETYQDYEVRFNRHFDDILDPGNRQQGRKRPLHEMNCAEAETEAQPDSTMPSPTSGKKPDLEGARRRYQAYAASVSSTDSAAEDDLKEDKGDSKDNFEEELAAKMRGVRLDGKFARNTPSDLPYGTHREAAKDQPSSTAASVLRDIPIERTSKAEGEHQHCSKAMKNSKADIVENSSKTDLSEPADGNAPKKSKRKARALGKLTLDDLKYSNKTAGGEINAKEFLESLPPRLPAPQTAQLERSISPNEPTLKPLLPIPQPHSSRAPKPSLLLSILPPEIRRLIYHHLLCTPKPIPGGELVEDKRAAIIIPDAVPPALNLSIDAIFLRTCRKIYSEALPILYQDNWFSFDKVSMLRIFRTKGLPMSKTEGYSPYRNRSVLRYLDSVYAHDFAFSLEPQGRLCLLRNVHLRFSHSGRPTNLRGMRSPLSDEPDWHGAHLDSWSEFLNEERYTDIAGFITFPALANLVLDFSDWELQPDEGLRVRVFETRFRGEEGLRCLTTIGLCHGGTILGFKERLLGRGGVMRVLERGALGGVV